MRTEPVPALRGHGVRGHDRAHRGPASRQTLSLPVLASIGLCITPSNPYSTSFCFVFVVNPTLQSCVGGVRSASHAPSFSSGKELARLQGYHRDVVCGVAFNPLFPQVATASFDGRVKFYIDPMADPEQSGI